MTEKSGRDVAMADQALAATETIADMAIVMYLRLKEKGIPEDLAQKIVIAAVSAWCSKGGKNG